MASNHTKAFATVTPLKKDVSDLINNQENLGFAYRAEKRAEAEINEQRQKANDEKIKELSKYREKIKPYDTESVTANTVIINAIAKKQEEIPGLLKIIQNRKESNEARMNAQAKLDDLANYPDKLKLITDRITERNRDYIKRKDAGEIYAQPEYEAKFQKGYAGMQIADDENGNPTLVFFDQNGDGISDFEKFEDIVNVNAPSPFMKKFNYEAQVKKAADAMGEDERIVQTGARTVETKKVLDDVINQTAKGLIENPEVLTSFARDLGLDYLNITPETKQTIEDKIKKDLRAQTDEKYKETIAKDFGLGAAKLAETKRQFDLKRQDEKSKDKKQPIDFSNVNLVSQVQKVTDKNDKRFGIDGAKGYTIPNSNMSRTIGTKGIEERVQTFYLLPGGGIALYGDKILGTIADESLGDIKTKGANIEKFMYKSKGSGAEAGVVADFITKEINPNTGKYFKSIKEFENLMRKNASEGKSEAEEFGL